MPGAYLAAERYGDMAICENFKAPPLRTIAELPSQARLLASTS
jgi:hypothetical protein